MRTVLLLTTAYGMCTDPRETLSTTTIIRVRPITENDKDETSAGIILLCDVEKEGQIRRMSDKISTHLLNQREKHREKMPQTHARPRVSPMRMVYMQWASRCPEIQRRLGNTDLHSTGRLATARSELDARKWKRMVPASPADKVARTQHLDRGCFPGSNRHRAPFESFFITAVGNTPRGG